MHKTIDDQVEVTESEALVAVKVAQFLQERGYIPANADGVRLGRPGSIIDRFTSADNKIVGILEEAERKKYKLPFGYELVSPPRLPPAWIGRIKTSPPENWVIEVYGRDKLPELTDLAKSLYRRFGTKVSVELTREDHDYEKYYHDD